MNEEDLDNASVTRTHWRWRHGCIVLAAVFLAIAVATCGLVGEGIRHSTIAPPYLGQRLGPVQLVAITTLTPDCALAFPCGPPLRITSPSLRRFYVIWLVVTWPGSNGGTISSYRLVAVPLER